MNTPQLIRQSNHRVWLAVAILRAARQEMRDALRARQFVREDSRRKSLTETPPRSI